ncbi:MAG: tail fiber domain-containing protein [Burkholderiaceae bacterium]
MKRSATWRNADQHDEALSSRRFCFGGGGSASPDPNIGLAALKEAQIGEDALNWYRGYVDSTLTPLQQRQADIDARASEQALRIADAQESRASQQWDDYQTTFRPIEQSMAAGAMKFDEAGYKDKLAGDAAASVQNAFAQSEAQTSRDLARQGVQVGSGQAIAMRHGAQLARAASMGAAANDARTNAEIMGFARKADVANLGRGIAAGSSASSQAALAGGAAASGAAGSSLAGASGIANTMGQGFGQAASATGASGGLFAESSGQRLRAAQEAANNRSRNTTAGIGAIATIGAAMLSDRKAKKDVQRFDDDEALDVVRDLPVYEYSYKEGRGDGKRHVGPMAQDVAKRIGGDSKSIDVGDLVSVSLGATKALDAKVEMLMKAVRAGRRG